MCIHLATICLPQRDGQTDRQTDRQTKMPYRCRASQWRAFALLLLSSYTNINKVIRKKYGLRLLDKAHFYV